MTRRSSAFRPVVLIAALALSRAAAATELSLHIVQYPDKRGVDVPFTATDRAPTGATLEADVKLSEGQARVDVSYEHMQPAALFGGHVASYVLWAVSRAGIVENLGELWIDGESGSLRFQTGMKEFAMFVTAEAVPGIWRPSDMVVFWSGPTRSKYAKNSTLAFSGFDKPSPHERESIGSLRWTGEEPIVLYQARRAFEVGTELGLEKYDEKAMREAKTTLAQATNSMNAGGSSKAVTDYARRTVALVTTAARAMAKAMDEQAAAEAAARRQAELDALEHKAAEARQSAAAADAARQQAEEAEQRADALRSKAELEKNEAQRARAEIAAAATALDTQKRQLEAQKRDLEAQTGRLEAQTKELEIQKKELETQMAELRTEKDAADREKAEVTAQRDALSKRLVDALALVADTRDTARGVIVSLSDILFDTNQAVLKPEARVTLAKLTGVLSVFPNLNLRVEGYTDSTGTDAINNKLSRDRAASVVEFLQSQGIAGARMTSEGYGSRFPVASNDAKEGRAKNRRVQVVLGEGVVAAPTS